MTWGESTLRVFRWTLFLSGLAALGYCAYVYGDTALYQSYQNWAFDERLHGRVPSVRGFVADSTPLRRFLRRDVVAAEREEVNATAARPETAASAPLRGVMRHALIGRIEIPRVDVHAIISEGDDDSTLRRAVGHIPSSALPGESGNVALAGHRDTFFRGLRSVRKNDRINVRTLDGDYEYLVDSTRVVRPNDVQVLAPTSRNVLTLVTCYPFNYVGNAPKRYIVRAREVRGPSAEDKSIAEETSAKPSTP